MVAEVKGTTSGLVAVTTQRPAAGEAPAVSNPAPTSALGSESVHFTKTAAELRELEKAVHEASDVDVERVNRLRQAIAEGSYQVDNDKLAQNLLRYEMMMSSGSRTGKQ